jgi:aryl-alcohol dehydrogenase-like predicted oxidoreductase
LITRKIGELEVSVLGIGCNNMGRGLDEAGTKAVVDAALECGITYFDTADKYGETRSEEFLGKALKSVREQVIIATKFGLVLPDIEGSGGASARWIRQAVTDSLRRLGTDYIDLYQLHRPDPAIPLAETLGALNALVAEGLVREIGVSNATAQDLREAWDLAQNSGLRPYRSVQNEYSMIRRDPESDGVLDFCARTETKFVPYYPLASGLLTGKYRHGQEDPSDARLATLKLYQDWFSDADRTRAKDIVAALDKEGINPLAAALHWILRRSEVGTVITGASRPEQVHANFRAFKDEWSETDLATVCSIVEQAGG